MQITVKIKLEPTKEQIRFLQATTKEYIRLVNQVVSDYVSADANLKYTTKDVIADLPSAVKNQAIQDAKSVFKKYKKNIRTNSRLKPEDQKKVKIPILKKPVAIWNNQNYSLNGNVLSFPVLIANKSKRIEVQTVLTDYQQERLKGKLGSLRITQKSGKYIAQISVEMPEQQSKDNKVMGVDLGLKIPAAAVVECGKTKFAGNGRENKFIKRKHRSVRRKLGKLKKLKAIEKRHDKEQRWMKKTSRKNEKNLHTWSFYRLAQYIEYKAILAGIKVEYVNPKHTSQKCPKCGEINKANDRKYKCGCGYKAHRDRVGAINIISATVVDGNSLSA